MWIMTEHGWRRLVTTTVKHDEPETSRRVKNGYLARKPSLMWAELANSVVFKD